MAAREQTQTERSSKEPKEPKEPTQREPARLDAEPKRTEPAQAERPLARSVDRRGPKSKALHWASANQRSASARAGWARRKAPPKAWARDARPPLSETDSRPREASGKRPALAAAWRRPRGHPHRPKRRSVPRAVEARAPALASGQTPGVRSPSVPARQHLVSPAMPAEPRPAEVRPARPASPRRTRWRCGRLLPPSPRNLRQRPRGGSTSRRPGRSGTLRHVDHLYSW